MNSENAKSSNTQSEKVAHVIEFSELEQIEEKSLHSAEPDRPAHLAGMLAPDQHPLRNLKARLTVHVGGAELTVGDLMNARENQVIRLDTAIDQPVDVLLEGHVVARGMLVAVDQYFAVRITEVPMAFGISHGLPSR